MSLGPLILDLVGHHVSDDELKLLEKSCVGGVILFSRNIEGYEQLQQLISEIRAVRPDLLICVDQEGGRVQRCRDGFTRIPPMQVFNALYEQNPVEACRRARDCGWLLAAEVLASGIDFSFTPVLDVDDEFCSVIGDRSFSSDPSTVTALSKAFIEGAHEAGMKVTGKHFPGHGSVRGDSHLELPVDGRSKEEIWSKDLPPFAEQSSGLHAMDAVMPAHILYPQIDAQQPVGFSKYWLKDILRKELSFEGVIFSDDLTMEGAAVAGDYCARAKLALDAGCDVILVCNHREGALQVISMLEESESYDVKPLSLMKPVNSWTRQQLETTERWQDTRVWLNSQLG